MAASLNLDEETAHPHVSLVEEDASQLAPESQELGPIELQEQETHLSASEGMQRVSEAPWSSVDVRSTDSSAEAMRFPDSYAEDKAALEAMKAALTSPRESFAAAEPSERQRRRSERAEAWGTRNAAATDWLRRDASELVWRNRQQRWSGSGAPTLSAAGARMSADDDLPFDDGDDSGSDWRMGEFERWLGKEQRLRRSVMRWWLEVWDSSGDDYLFDESEMYEPTYPREVRPPRARRAASRPSWEEEETLYEPPQPRSRTASSLRTREPAWREGGAANVDDDVWVPERTPLVELGSTLLEDSVTAPTARSGDGGGAAADQPADELINALLEDEEALRSRERAKRMDEVAKRMEESASRIEGRLRSLHDALVAKVEELEDAEAAAAAQELQSRAQIKELRSKQAAYVWPDELSALPSSFAQAEQTVRRKQAEHAELHAQRIELSEALARALSRLSELQQVGSELRSGGMPALQRLLARRRLSRPLQKYLREIM